MLMNFTKMHGLGNDFVVIDAINQSISLSEQQIRKLADRNFGIGFDQLLMVDKPMTANADFKYRIFNADGSEVAQCGNGARCFARFVRDKKLTDKDEIVVETKSGQLILRFADEDLITVDMGIPRHLPSEIPLIAEQEARFYTVKTNETDGYYALQLGVGEQHLRKVKKPQLGHFIKVDLPPKKLLREFFFNKIKKPNLYTLMFFIRFFGK